MHGTEGEVYANPQRCPQISLIDSRGVQVLHERQSDTHDEPLSLPATKDPEITARWIERCLAGHEPVPQSLKNANGLLSGCDERGGDVRRRACARRTGF